MGGGDLADIQLLLKFKKDLGFLFCVMDIYSKYAQVVLLKEKKVVTITKIFQKIFEKSGRKPKNIWVDEEK